MHAMTDEFAAGRRAARRDRFRHGRKQVKIKSETSLHGHTLAFKQGYRDYARAYCPVRRNIDF
jgi:hypothetical protein